jgi:RNA polymerase sigma-70 factor (ECF subfamily)
LRPPPDSTQAPEPGPLLHRVAAGDRAAVADCVARFGGVVWSLARRLSPSEAEAEDAAQEIFLDLWKSAGRYDPSLQSEVAFVAMIARRRLIDRRRKRQRAPEGVPLAEAAEPAAPAQGEVCAEASMALRALDDLRPEQREILVLSAVQGLSHEEIAQHKQMPLGTVKAHARRALLRVRSLLLGTPPEEAP